MIKRDSDNYVGQHEKYNASAALEFGDGAARVGILALCGSKIDQDLHHTFITKELELVRHPCDKKWSNSKLTSRDQLVQYCAFSNVLSMNFCSKWSRKLFMNKDILTPDVRLYLRLCAGEKPGILLKLTGYAFHYAAIIYASYCDYKVESNQLIAISNQLGTLDFLVKAKVNLFESIEYYWGDDVYRDPDQRGWRDQKEIGEILIKFIWSKT